MNEASTLSARYRVVAELQGGASDVYIAVVDDKRLVVLKTPRRAFAEAPELSTAFRSEARLTARLRHPNIVEVQEILEDAGAPVLVMEFLDGATLREIVEAAHEQARPLAIREHLDIIRQVCLGLHYCHDLRDFEGEPLGLIHRDISPQNIFVTVDDQVKLLDFGIAKFDGAQGSTKTGLIKGQLRYMSPEQMAGEKLNRKTDIYAVGVLLWEAATGRPLWNDISDALIVGRVLTGDLPKVDTLVEGCPPSVLDLARHCLATKAEDRPDTCEFIAEALELELEAMPPADMRAGKLTARLFEDRRSQLRAKITAGVNASTAGQLDHSLIDWRHPNAAHEAITQTAPPPSDDIDFATRSRWPWVLGLIGVAGGLGAFWMNPQCTLLSAGVADPSAQLSFELDPPPSSAVAGNPIAVFGPPELSHSLREPESIYVAIDVHPAENVEVRVDGEALAPPFSLQALRDGREHTIVASAPGFESASETVTFDQDLKLRLSLTPTGETSVPPVKHSHRSTARRHAPPRAEPEKPSTPSGCDPPFDIDEKGHKRFKRACL